MGAPREISGGASLTLATALSQDSVSATPFDSHLLCAAIGVQTLFIIIRVHRIA